MSTPILPFAVWAPGTNQNSIPANDNSLRHEILNGLVISDATDAQPGSPADGDIYIITGTATGAQWATFDEFDLAIYDSGTWYAYAPVEGIVVNVAGTLKRWNGSGYVDVSAGGSAAIPALQFVADLGSTADSDPGAGLLKWNHATQASATVIYIDDDTSDGVTMTALWPALKAGGFLVAVHATNQAIWQEWRITGVTDATGYVKLAVSLVAKSTGNFADGDAMLLTIGQGQLVMVQAAVSDETTALTTGTAKVTFRTPCAMTLLPGHAGVRCSVSTAPTGASLLTVDINEAGVSILSTKLTIDASEKTSTSAATPPVISDASLADDAEMTVDIDQIGSTIAGAGLKIALIGYPT